MEKRKTVFVTGGSRGIGAACVRLLAKKGYQVAIGYLTNREKAEALAVQLNGEADGEIRAAAIYGDVSQEEEVKHMFAEIRSIFGSVDALVNNAGISEFSLFTDISGEKWDRMMAVNCKGVFLCTKEALADMLTEKAGSIVNISSMWGQVGSSCEVHYSASKAAVIGLTKALAKELGPSHIRVNCVAPGVIQTDMLEGVSEEIKAEMAEETPLMRLGTPEDIASVVCFLISEDAAFLTGQVIGASGGFII